MGSLLNILSIQGLLVRRNFEKRRVELDERILDRSVLIVAGVTGRVGCKRRRRISATET